jgi:crotonobetainyl-CoA:carnitine CoA-transferase CaiB-like acyl-CoA transferase
MSRSLSGSRVDSKDPAGRRPALPSAGVRESVVSATSHPGPLARLRILDLGTFVAAPFCATILAEFGADVLKVEMPRVGDSLRTLGPEKKGEPLFWLQESRNKRAITINLGDVRGQTVVRELVAAGYDIILENFRPGTLERWNLSYDSLKESAPGVILARISGYGQTGPARNLPAFGRVAQAFGGLTYLCGFPDRPPANPGSATIADYVAGLFAAFGVLVASKHREATGEGQVIDVALYESIFRIMDSLAITYSATGVVREREGTGTPTAAPHNHYPTADGHWVAIACTSDRVFARLAVIMRQPDLIEDPRFRDPRLRATNRDELDRIVAHWTGSQAIASIIQNLAEAEVPCSRINSIADIFADPQYLAREALLVFNHPSLGRLQMPAVVPRLSQTPGHVSWLGPGLGEHTDTVLREVLGYTSDQLALLRAEGSI